MNKFIGLFTAFLVSLGLVVGAQPSANASAYAAAALNCQYEYANHANITGTLSVETVTAGYKVVFDLNDAPGPSGNLHYWGWTLTRNNVAKDSAFDVYGDVHFVKTYDNGGQFDVYANSRNGDITCHARVTL